MAALFTERGRVEISYNNSGKLEPLGEVVGQEAIAAQFVVFEVRGKERPATGWPEGAFGAQGTVTPIESGYSAGFALGEWRMEDRYAAHRP